MSVSKTTGEEVRLPSDPEAFRHTLETLWAGKNRHRWKQLAILQLLGDGWTVENIAQALHLNRSHVHRVINRSRKGIYEFVLSSSAR